MKKTLHLTSSQTIMLGFAFMIFIGAFLLNLPISSATGESVGFLNALFTSTSANCVTGLSIVNTKEQWSLFGKLVILILVQFGALGFMTVMTIALLLVNKQITLRNRQTIQASFNQDSIGGMVRLVKRVVSVTFIFEMAGAVILAACFKLSASMGMGEAVFQGVFHSISAFCNAGIDNIGTESLISFQNNIPVNFTIMALIVAGGIGFTVWGEIGMLIKNPHKKPLRLRLIHLSLHSKIVFVMTIALTVTGTIMFLLFEWHNPQTFGTLSIYEKIQAALFQSVTLRTAGFSTVHQNELTEISKFFSCILMIIGGSSASTAGGIKTVTLGIIIISMISALRGRNRLEAFGRTLPLELLQKALTVTITIMFVVFVSAIILYFTERGTPYPYTFWDLLYESFSAASTTGITTGITPYLSPAGRIVLIICMYLGRLSPVTVVVALNTKLNAGTDSIKLPYERVIIG